MPKTSTGKKVAIGVGTTIVVTGVVLLSGGSAAPVLLSAAIGSGSGAVFNGVFTAVNGGSIADIAESASDGFMWGAIGGSFGGGTTVLLSESAAAGSSLMGNPFVQRLLQGAADTAVDTAQSASKGLPVTPEGILINMTCNTLMAGGIGSGGKQPVNEAVDETADSIGDSVRREVKSGGNTDFYVTPSGDAIPATGYRYMDSKYAEQTMESMSAPGSYFGFKKFDSASEAQDAFQIASEWSDCKLRGEFDTLQVVDEMYVPKAYGDKGPGLEPFTRCYPEYGKGGCQQFIYKGKIYFKNVDIIDD